MREIILADTADLVASYISAISTLIAVILALFLQVILVRLRRPGLFVTFSDEPASTDLTSVESVDKSDYWIHVKVWNRKGRSAARNAEAFVIRVIRPESSPNEGNVPATPLGWCHLKDPQIDIPSGIYRSLDVVRYCKERTESSDTYLICAWPGRRTWPPRERDRLTGPGCYEVHFAITCDEAEPSFWCLSFTFAPCTAQSAMELGQQISDIRLRELPPRDAAAY